MKAELPQAENRVAPVANAPESAGTKDELDIYSCQTAAEFIRLVLSRKRNGRPVTTLRAFSRRAGIRSPATLSLILQEKRAVTETVADQVAQALKLTGYRRRYWLALAELSRTPSPESRINLNEELLQLRYFAKPLKLELKQYEFLSRWFYCVLYVMASDPGVPLHFEWLAHQLGRGITAKEVEKAVTDMESLGLLRRENNLIKQVDGAFVNTGEDIRIMSARKFHRKMIALASEAMEIPLDEREINGLTVRISREDVPEFKKKIWQFMTEVHEFVERRKGVGAVYQMNIQFFPLTKKVAEPELVKVEEPGVKAC